MNITGLNGIKGSQFAIRLVTPGDDDAECAGAGEVSQ